MGRHHEHQSVPTDQVTRGDVQGFEQRAGHELDRLLGKVICSKSHVDAIESGQFLHQVFGPGYTKEASIL